MQQRSLQAKDAFSGFSLEGLYKDKKMSKYMAGLFSGIRADMLRINGIRRIL